MWWICSCSGSCSWVVGGILDGGAGAGVGFDVEVDAEGGVEVRFEDEGAGGGMRAVEH